MKETQLFWEGAEWARDLIGHSEGEQCFMVCDNVSKTLAEGDHPEGFKRGARALVRVARDEAQRFVHI